MTLKDFKKSGISTDATLRNLEIIGEATAQLQKDIKEKYHDIPWKDIQDFRIVVAHRYWSINRERVWDIIKTKLDPLKQQIQNILEKESNENEEKT